MANNMPPMPLTPPVGHLQLRTYTYMQILKNVIVWGPGKMIHEKT
jgi:hypothetical protein